MYNGHMFQNLKIALHLPHFYHGRIYRQHLLKQYGDCQYFSTIFHLWTRPTPLKTPTSSDFPHDASAATV